MFAITSRIPAGWNLRLEPKAGGSLSLSWS